MPYIVTRKDYSMGFEYSDLRYEAYYHGDGRITLNDEKRPQYEYNIKDHLGNSRVFFTDADGDGSPEVLQREDYYSFGLTHQGTPFQFLQRDALTENAYLYNNKEMNTDLGLNWLDYGFRFYDAALGIWHVVDPMGETGHSLALSPYHYVANNPINNIDLFGLDWYQVGNKYYYNEELTKDNADAFFKEKNIADAKWRGITYDLYEPLEFFTISSEDGSLDLPANFHYTLNEDGTVGVLIESTVNEDVYDLGTLGAGEINVGGEKRITDVLFGDGPSGGETIVVGPNKDNYYNGSVYTDPTGQEYLMMHNEWLLLTGVKIGSYDIAQIHKMYDNFFKDQ